MKKRNLYYLKLFFFGAILNFIYLGFLFCFDVSRHNLSPLSSEEVKSLWFTSDSGTYIRSARAFVDRGVFAGSDGLPDNHRTVGYPAFLAFAMKLGGTNWLFGVFIFQALWFATVYPSLAYLCSSWFSLKSTSTRNLVILYALLGAGFVYTPIFLTDQAFTATFWASLALGTYALKNGGWRVWIGHLLLLLFAANIRPTLALFPFAFFALAVSLKVDWRSRKFQMMLLIMVQLFICQTPAIRNYIHHGSWIPSDVMVNNLSDYLAKDVLSYQGEMEIYNQAKSKWENLPLQTRVKEQSAFAKKVFLADPFLTVGIAVINFTVNTVETHYIQTLHYFRTSLHSDLKRFAAISVPLLGFHLVWAVIHGGIALAALGGLWIKFRRGEYAWLVFVLIFMLPYAFSATDIQGARFRLYCEGLILMSAAFLLESREEKT